jgi:hypothetical protein
MAKDYKLIIKIDAYLKGHLSEEETTAFEKEMAVNTALSEQVARQRVHLEALDILLEDDLRAKLAIWSVETDHKPRHTRQWKLCGIGLAIIAVLLVFYFWVQSKKEAIEPVNLKPNQQDSAILEKKETRQNSKDTLKTKPNPTIQKQKTPPSRLNRAVPSVLEAQKPIAATQTLPNDILTSTNEDLAAVLTDLENNMTRGNTSSDKLLAESFRLMRQKDYSKALNSLENVPYTEGSLTRAMAYFLNGQYAQALPIFETLANNKGFDRLEMAEYYTALCLFANKQKNEAQQRLTKIAADTGNQYSNKAKMGLKSLGY